jgi:TolA-binding protein
MWAAKAAAGRHHHWAVLARKSKGMSGKAVIRIVVAMLLAWAFPGRTFADSKDIVRLKTQLDLLQQEVTRLQSTLDERLDTMKQLQESNAANALKLQQSLNAMNAELQVRQSRFDGRTEEASSRINAMNAGLQDLKTRLAAVSERTFAALPASGITAPNAVGSGNAVPVPPVASPPAPTSPVASAAVGSASSPAPASSAPSTPAVTVSPSDLAQLYKSAVSHYSGQQFDLATSEFDRYLKLAPNGDLAPSAYFYLAECEYEQEDFEGALQDYTAAIPGLGSTPKASTAAYKRGLTLLELQQDKDAISQLQFVVARYPQSSEARKAKQKLRELGVVMPPGR